MNENTTSRTAPTASDNNISATHDAAPASVETSATNVDTSAMSVGASSIPANADSASHDAMNVADFLARYREVNESFAPRLVFRTGIDAGFFAEFKYMVNAVIFCLNHRIQFCLYSRGANYSVAQGWGDFFRPFCREVTDGFHARYNIHALPPMAELSRRNPGVPAAKLAVWKAKTAVRAAVCRLMSLAAYGRATLSTYDVPQAVEERCVVPELQLDCTYDEAFRLVASMLWRLNDDVLREKRALLESISLPAHYAAMQIRGGDKVTEVSLLSSDIFVRALRRATSERHVLLLTDDYGVLESVREAYPDYVWHSLCTPQERGYVNAAFTRTDAAAKRQRMTRFLAQVDAMLHSDTFVGSITVGPSLFALQMLHPRGIAVDCAAADLPRLAPLTIRERGIHAARYLRTQAE